MDTTTGDETLLRSFTYGNYIDEVLCMQVPGDPDPVEYYYAHDHLYSVRAVLADDGGVEERGLYDAYGYPDWWLYADYNRDRYVEWADWGIFSGAWQLGEDDSGYVWETDVNNDGTIEWTDHAAFYAQWQDQVPADQVSYHGNPYLFTGRRADYLDDPDNDGSGKVLYYYRARYYDPDNGRFLSRDPAGYVDGMNLIVYVDNQPQKWTDPSGKKVDKCSLCNPLYGQRLGRCTDRLAACAGPTTPTITGGKGRVAACIGLCKVGLKLPWKACFAVCGIPVGIGKLINIHVCLKDFEQCSKSAEEAKQRCYYQHC